MRLMSYNHICPKHIWIIHFDFSYLSKLNVNTEMSRKLYVIKIGGNVIDDPIALQKFLIDFSSIKEKKILIHGGGKIATGLAKKFGVSQEIVNGRRITNEETLKVITMVYAGLINKNIVAQLQGNNCNAIGLTGADANMIPAKKRPADEINYGFVGDVDYLNINTRQLEMFLNNELVPVFAPITHDKLGQLLNTNADTIASALAMALAKSFEVSLIYCFEKKGVLKNMEDDNSVIPVISKSEYKKLIADGFISKGMIPKTDTGFDAISKGVETVIIGHSAEIIQNLNSNQHAGTKLVG